eukprot:gene21875-33611_t
MSSVAPRDRGMLGGRVLPTPRQGSPLSQRGPPLAFGVAGAAGDGGDRGRRSGAGGVPALDDGLLTPAFRLGAARREFPPCGRVSGVTRLVRRTPMDHKYSTVDFSLAAKDRPYLSVTDAFSVPARESRLDTNPWRSTAPPTAGQPHSTRRGAHRKVILSRIPDAGSLSIQLLIDYLDLPIAVERASSDPHHPHLRLTAAPPPFLLQDDLPPLTDPAAIVLYLAENTELDSGPQAGTDRASVVFEALGLHDSTIRKLSESIAYLSSQPPFATMRLMDKVLPLVREVLTFAEAMLNDQTRACMSLMYGPRPPKTFEVFIAGGALTVADFLYFPELMQWQHLVTEHEHPNLTAYFARMANLRGSEAVVAASRAFFARLGILPAPTAGKAPDSCVV